MVNVVEVDLGTSTGKLLAAQKQVRKNENLASTDEYILSNTDVSLAGSYNSSAGEDLMQAGQDTE